MTPFTRILLDIDADAPSHDALEWGTTLARASGARLTLTDVITPPAEYARHDLPAGLEAAALSEPRERLAQIAGRVEGVDADARLLIGRPATVLIQEVLASGHDLLVRSHVRDGVGARSAPFGAVDMELLRKCPCPVLLVRHGRWHQAPRIVGAVNASTEDADEQALNQRIVETTLHVAELLGGTALLLQAWSPFAERVVRRHAPDPEFAAYIERVRARSANDLKALARTFGVRLSDGQTVHRRGEPEAVIPEFAATHGTDLVVMGTVARAGVAGLLVGNTAERVFSRLPCSVLAVKPAGFVSPVPPLTDDTPAVRDARPGRER